MNYVQRTSWFRFVALLVAALGLLASACTDDSNETSGSGEDTAESDESGDHMHDLYEVPNGTPIPTLSISVEPDPVAGANLYVKTTNYTVSPEHASTEPAAGEGHFHAYVDGEKVARFYNEALHLKLDEGEHTVLVELSANNHSPYAVDGEPITATKTITITSVDAGHQHSDPVEAGDVIPTIELSANVDPKSGWNLFADIENFNFAPSQAGHKPVDGEGHVHLYVDGEKKGRLYGPWWHLSGLSIGSHEVKMELTANNHAPLASGGETIASTVTIEVSEDQAAGTESEAETKPESSGHDHADEDRASNSGHDGAGPLFLDLPAADADVVIELQIVDGELAIESNRFEVDEGSTVGIIATGNVADQLHVHGFDVLKPLDENNPIDVAFTADQSGLFEVELEDAGLFLFDILVK